MPDRDVERKKSMILVAVGIAVVLLGVLGFILGLSKGIEQMSSSFQRFVVPGSILLNVPESTAFNIFHEHKSQVEGRDYIVQSIPPLDITVTLEGEETIPVSSPVGSTTYRFGPYAGYSYGSFMAEKPGQYTISASYARGAEGPPTVLALADSSDRTLVFTIVIGLAIMGSSLTIGILLIVFGLRKNLAYQQVSSIADREDDIIRAPRF